MNRLENFEMWIKGRMLKIPWTFKMTNMVVLQKADIDRSLLKKNLGHILRGEKYDILFTLEGRGIGRKLLSCCRGSRISENEPEYTAWETCAELQNRDHWLFHSLVKDNRLRSAQGTWHGKKRVLVSLTYPYNTIVGSCFTVITVFESSSQIYTVFCIYDNSLIRLEFAKKSWWILFYFSRSDFILLVFF